MMGFENEGGQEAHLYASREEMESLVLDDPSTDGRGAGSGESLSSDSHPYLHPLSPSSLPFAEIATDDDPPGSSPSSVFHPANPNTPFNSILEPPSYADAIFRSFDRDHTDVGEINGHDSSGEASSSSSLSGSDYIRISVSDPQKEQELSNSLVPGGGTYYTYLITTRTNMPHFGGAEFSVRRRFKEVVTLSDRLSESYRGFFIPVRPDKSVVESQVMQKQEFVEQRRAALEKYLRKLASHPVLKRSDELRVFLQVEGKLPLVRTTDVASRMLDGAVKFPRQLFGDSVGAVNLNEVVQPAKGGRDLLRIFKELKQSVTNEWGGTKPPLVEEDKEFLEKKEKLQDFEQQISHVSQQVAYLF